MLECALQPEMLTSAEGVGDILSVEEVRGLSTAKPSRAEEEAPGSMIGRYELLEKIGEGGFGVVYVAEQREPVKRRIALKIIKLGMDTRQIVARFEAERQALALMDHPNIAKVFDGGATDAGRPYFVMELVRGMKITDYCDQNNLSARERLDLFIQVCQAIQHAHQKGIIHRDIKPSNVLVTVNDGAPVPKVIDFGIAKATQGELTEKTVYTQFQQLIGTPAYMSPEQAEITSLDIDTRSDIYALGVLLYELLTGKTPFEHKELVKAGLDGMRRIIREQEPVRPSTRFSSLQIEERTTTAKRRGMDPPKLVHLLRGDLDWIVMKCLEKGRTRRYETANGLALDIQRYLKHEPVVAARPSKLYAFRKFARRHRIALATTTAFAVLLVAGVIISTWQAVRASRAEKAAQAEAGKRLTAFVFMASMLEGVGPSAAKGRDTAMLREILDNTAKRVGTDLKDQPEAEADLRIVLGKTYADLGQTTNALEMTKEALRLRRKALGPTNSAVAEALNNLGAVSYDLSDYAGAEKAAREALAIRMQLFGPNNTNVALSLNNLGLALWIEGKLAEAEETTQRALDTRKRLLPVDSPDIGMTLVNLAGIQWARARFSQVEQSFNEAAQLFEKAGKLVAFGVLRANLATVYARRGDLEAAQNTHTNTLALRRKLFNGRDHPHTEISLTQLALVLTARGKLDEAETDLKEAIAMQERLGMGKHADAADALFGLGNVLARRGDWAAAEEKHQRALAMRIEVLKGEENADVVDSLDALALIAVGSNNLSQAEQLLSRAVQASHRSENPDYPAIIAPLWHLDWVLSQKAGSTAHGTNHIEALQIAGKHGVYGGWPLLKSMYDLADILRLQGKFADAERVYEESRKYVEQSLADNKPLQRDAFHRFASFYESWDHASPDPAKSKQSQDWNKRAEALSSSSPPTRL
jgi:tetratricopeptide (TPR) repeat protein/tRNA A-37 threonylcarbamoyl transferase component Bud32